MHLYQAQFSEDLDLPDTPVLRTVLIASTPRCGSHMLGHAMARTGLLGVPFEYLNPANLARWQEKLDTTGAQDTLEALTKRRTTANGTFGIKAHFTHCETMGGPDKLFAALPGLTVVHIRRADVMRQAISYAVARQTGVWIAGQDPTEDAASFDADLIDLCLGDIALQNARWSAAFDAAGIAPVDVIYEAAERDLAATVTRIAREAGVIGARDSLAVEAQTARQSRKAATDDWVERYASARQRPASPLARLRRRISRSVR
jgi:LPS sulfotransferase NodH